MIFKNKLIFLIALVLVVAGGITLAFNSLDVFGNNDNKKVVEDKPFTNIEVLTNNAAVEIVPTKSSEATVEYSGANKKAKFIFDVDVNRDTLSVQLKEKRRFFWFGFHTKDLTLTVSLPEKQYENIQVESDNGRIHVEDIKAEEIKLETDNGQISLKNVETKLANIDSDNGRVILDHVQGEINGELDNGHISVTTNDLKWPMDLRTDNGSIEIKTESEPTNATIDAKTDNGKITIFGAETNHAIFGKGKHLINLQTDNGRITVTK